MRLALALLSLFVCSSAFATTTQLRLNDEINDETVTPLVDAIEAAPADKADAVVLEINSPGGEVDAGFRLVKAIERYAGAVICIVDGEADSMASYILMSCDVRAMTRRSLLMIHQPGAGARGQLNDVQNVADWLAAYSTAEFEQYAAHMLVTAEWLADRCAGGRALWMDWHTAQKYGAVDIVVDRVGDVLGVH